ncbi:alkylation response protein AidB-like acyl-CoA dehydrogenase, partial [Microbacterium halimionae]
MDFAPDSTAHEITERARTFLTEHVLPAEPILDQQLAAAPEDWAVKPIVRDLQQKARDESLWNLFLPGENGAGLTNLQYAPVAEVTGWSQRLAPVAFNCAAPDTGNMEVLNDFGTPAQKEQWLEPLMSAEIRSSFCMTEPDTASSDATNIGTRIRRDGDHYIVSGRKWWSTGAMNPDAAIFIVMGKTDPDADRHRQQSMILVPRDSPGVRTVRPLSVFGYDDRDHGGHAEIAFDDVRVPAANLIAGEGDGFAIAQARLGPGR